MARFIIGILIMLGGLAIFGASAVRSDVLGLTLAIGFMAVGGIIAASGGNWGSK